MKEIALLPVIGALGLRHGLDPDHLAAIDGLSRFHPSRWNGVLFALGHGVLVTALAVGFGHSLARWIEPYTMYVLVLLGGANLWRLLRPSTHHHTFHQKLPKLLQGSPLVLGVVFGMGFETSSQLAALLLSSALNPWVMGAVFSAGMIAVDGTDGLLAARTQRLARSGSVRARRSSQILGVLVACFSFLLAALEGFHLDVDRYALPLGVGLFAALIALRLWSSMSHAEPCAPNLQV